MFITTKTLGRLAALCFETNSLSYLTDDSNCPAFAQIKAIKNAKLKFGIFI